MDKILTAEEFIKDAQGNPSKGWTAKKIMIEFAKMHVEAAINTCIEEAPSGSSTDTVSYEDIAKALKDCYPLENIK